MESKNHEIVSSELVYKFGFLQIILNLCKSLTKNKCVFLLYTTKFKSDEDIDKNNPSFEFNFFWPREVTRKMLQEMPAALDFVKTLPKTPITNGEVNRMVKQKFPEALDKTSKMERWHKIVTQRLLSSYGNKEYYLGISQSTVYGCYHIYLIRHDLNVKPPMVTFFQLTMPAARALLSRLPAALVAANNLQETCIATKLKTIPLESTTTDMV